MTTTTAGGGEQTKSDWRTMKEIDSELRMQSAYIAKLERKIDSLDQRLAAVEAKQATDEILADMADEEKRRTPPAPSGDGGGAERLGRIAAAAWLQHEPENWDKHYVPEAKEAWMRVGNALLPALRSAEARGEAKARATEKQPTWQQLWDANTKLSQEKADLERRLEEAGASLATSEEVRTAQRKSTENLAAYATDDGKYELPMSGRDLATRDAIRSLRATVKQSREAFDAAQARADAWLQVCRRITEKVGFENVKPLGKTALESALAWVDLAAAAQARADRAEGAARWRDATKEKPAEGTYDLLLFSTQHGQRRGWFVQGEFRWCWCYGDDAMSGGITHWMPLPPAPGRALAACIAGKAGIPDELKDWPTTDAEIDAELAKPAEPYTPEQVKQRAAAIIAKAKERQLVTASGKALTVKIQDDPPMAYTVLVEDGAEKHAEAFAEIVNRCIAGKAGETDDIKRAVEQTAPTWATTDDDAMKREVEQMAVEFQKERVKPTGTYHGPQVDDLRAFGRRVLDVARRRIAGKSEPATTQRERCKCGHAAMAHDASGCQEKECDCVQPHGFMRQQSAATPQRRDGARVVKAVGDGWNVQTDAYCLGRMLVWHKKMGECEIGEGMFDTEPEALAALAAAPEAPGQEAKG